MIEKIPFSNQQASNQEVLAGATPVAINVVSNGLGVMRRRPGIKTYSGAYSGVVDADGLANLYVTTHGAIYAVSNRVGAERPIYRITSGGKVSLGGGGPPFGLRGTSRPVFAETEMILAIAGGDLIEKVILATDLTDRLGGDPPLASHVVAQANRLLANDVLIDRSAVRFSDTFGGLVSYAGAESWAYGGFGTSGYFTAQTRPDDVAALGQTLSHIYVFGTQTVQIFQQDADFTFAPVVTMENGLGAPYSIISADGSLFWFDNLRRFIVSSGQGMQVLSDDIQSQLDALSSVDDCFGYRIVIDAIDCVAWAFPTDGITFVYQKGQGWGQWMARSAGNWAPFSVTGHAMLPDQAVNLVSTSDGKIGMLSFDTQFDFDETIDAFMETGYLNRNADTYKLCKGVKLTLRRGTTTSDTGPQAFLDFRDREGEWSTIPVDLGASGDNEIVVPFYSLGTYRRRQWRFRYSGDEALALVSAVEDYDVLSV